MAASRKDAVPLAERAAAAPSQRRRQAVSDADLASVRVTNPNRVMFGPGGPTKLELAVYYAAVADRMLPELSRRPVSLVRCPQGERENCFFQRHAGQSLPESVKRVALREESSQKRGDYLFIDDGRGFLALVQFGTVEFHPWGCRIDKLERPDRMIFDLDPDEGLRWSEVVRAARDIRDRLGEIGLVPFVKTTGGKGLHVVVPVVRRQTWSAIFRFSEGFAAGLARAEPHRFTASMAKADRRERIFVDFHRNSRGSSAVAAYSLRARPGVAAAAPVAWPELSDIEDPGELNWASVPRWLRDRPDPWRNIDQCARALTKDMARKVGADIQS
jgi:DNA ligase D